MTGRLKESNVLQVFMGSRSESKEKFLKLIKAFVSCLKSSYIGLSLKTLMIFYLQMKIKTELIVLTGLSLVLDSTQGCLIYMEGYQFMRFKSLKLGHMSSS